ncbi:uncharacterized protein LOC120299080 [Crotalus tigris]|uniref:uncharacterized protein LOC120299080 n=1 Tax=Crotalus tigris TaxID=88082 RepID=UPI00192F6B3A|nr:uncharacterized protein LOC120299080 [Crotalus tigris]
MAGKLFPETYIGDSEEVCRKNPSGKKHYIHQRDIKSASLLSFDNISHDSENLVDSGELKEQLNSEGIPHNEEIYVGKDKETEQVPSSYQKEEQEGNQEQQKPLYTNLLDFRWLQEKEEEEAAHQDNSSSVLEDLSSQGLFAKHSACDVQEGLWPPPGDNTEERLEPRVNEVSLIDSFESDGKLLPNTNLSKSSCLDSSSVDHEGYYLCDEEALLKESSASTGYYPCYRTYVEFPRYQPPTTSDRTEKKGSPRDASVQCDGLLAEEATGREERRVEANNNLKELNVSGALWGSSHGQPTGGSRPGSGGRKLEGPGGRHLRPSSGDQEPGSPRKEQEGTLKPRTPGNSPFKSSARLRTSKEPPASLPRNHLLLPTANISRKSPQKRKHRSGQADEKEQATAMELKPLLHNQRSLPPSPEAKAGSPGVRCYRTEQAKENSQVQPVKEKKSPSPRQLPPAVTSTVAAESPPSSAKPHTASSRLSLHIIVSWVWKIFKKPPSAQPQPSTSGETEIGGSRQPLTSWLRLWLTQRSSRIHPRPP